MDKRIPERYENISGNTLNVLYPNDRIAIMREIAPSFRFTIQILVGEGGEYLHKSRDSQTGKIETYTGTVPEGKSYIGIDGQKEDIDDFWNAVEAKAKAQQPPANPPKV